MDEQYQAYLLAQIREYFYKKFDSFMIEKWSGSPLEDPIPSVRGKRPMPGFTRR